MASSTTIPLPARSALLGVLAGARSMTPLAVLVLNHHRPSLAGAWQTWPVLREPAGRLAIVLAAAGELVVDKLPATPSRTKPGPLLGRIGSGALVGAALATTGRGEHVNTGAVLGAIGGLVGTLAGAALRTGGQQTGLPDAVFAVVEDAATITCALAMVSAE
ncbi:DUF4126 domain-containing protein [Amnibacterium kyonggiense]|uniref:Putative membrane protein n=1 Tax=Amnibacterium kyonggiense TaxID=595671 RepID=A0A4V3EB81_9MICO|nr:DUF4126 domain-containing protein [Amnibacterium kyonggiense]TDS80764.1 putative membrane protein [Amnibacterium kyonggiense]